MSIKILNDIFQLQEAKIKKDQFRDIDIIRIEFTDIHGNFLHPFLMNKKTAIKFSKILRTEINKITESEVKNGKGVY